MNRHLSVTNQKKALRAEILGKRREMPAERREAADASITAQILEHPDFIRAKTVFAYVSMPHEVRTRELLCRILAAGKVLGLPVCDAGTHTLTFYRLDSCDELTEGKYRIPVPPVSEERLLTPDADTLVLVPMLAFDDDGYRLGAGGGYYDRFLAAYGHCVRIIGICYAENRIAHLPHDAYDQKIPCCITEQKQEERYG
ncbi:MAG: 5-formyltetrahydrofolate cyclo-ligase [Oscillospiraceae bacterium]|nr:5-formyltetrahydrofolate cyclo-ligase [Oscillospiraceae bacterium]